MQTVILVLLILLVGVLSFALYITNKEVRHLKEGVVKTKHDMDAVHSLLTDLHEQDDMNNSNQIMEDLCNTHSSMDHLNIPEKIVEVDENENNENNEVQESEEESDEDESEEEEEEEETNN